MDETNEDSWLYGTSNPDSTTNEQQADEKHPIEPLTEPKTEAENEAQALDQSVQISTDETVTTVKEEIEHEEHGDFEDPAHEMEEDEAATALADTTDGEAGGGGGGIDDDDAGEDPKQQLQQQQSRGSGGSDDDDDEDDSDDDINVVIGDIKSGPSTYNIKQRGNLLAAGQAGGEKSKGASQGGKFTLEDFDGVGSINGVAAHEFSIDSLEDKPWRKPGADITDYFNYGFNEETWRAYCERQKRFRVVESGVGLASLTQNLNQSMERHGEHGPLPPPGINAGGLSNEQMPGTPQGMMPPPMNVHHHGQLVRNPLSGRTPRTINTTNSGNQTKENAIQVMTAECREYSRPGQIASNFGGPPNDEPFFPEPEPFDYGYEPTQESQWGNNDNNPGWVPTGIKELTPGPTLVQPPSMAGPPGVPPPQMSGPPPQIRGPPPQMMGGMGGNMPMGPPPPHVMGQMMMGPGGGPMRMSMGPMGMMPPQQHGGPPQVQVKIEPMEERQQRSPTRRNRSRSPHRSRRRSKSPIRQRRSRSRSKSRKTRVRRSRSNSKARKTTASSRTSSRRSRSRSGSKSRKTTRTHRSRSRSKEIKSHAKRSRRSHSRSRTKSPKAAATAEKISSSSSSSSSSKKRSEKTEK